MMTKNKDTATVRSHLFKPLLRDIVSPRHAMVKLADAGDLPPLKCRRPRRGLSCIGPNLSGGSVAGVADYSVFDTTIVADIVRGDIASSFKHACQWSALPGSMPMMKSGEPNSRRVRTCR